MVGCTVYQVFSNMWGHSIKASCIEYIHPETNQVGGGGKQQRLGSLVFRTFLDYSL